MEAVTFTATIGGALDTSLVYIANLVTSNSEFIKGHNIEPGAFIASHI